MEPVDVLEKLEARIDDLLAELDLLREDNQTLRATAAGLAELRQENRELRDMLEQNQRLHTELAGRLDGLLARVIGHMEPTDAERERDA